MSNVPKLRFKEFGGEWEEKKLRNVAIINPKTEELPENFYYIDLESVNKGSLTKLNSVSKVDAPSRAKRLLSKNDILFQTVRPYQRNNYLFNLNNRYVASTGYAQIRAKESTKFLYHKLHTDKFVDSVMLRCTGTSYPAINSTDLSGISFYLPSKPEQEKIASFLTSIDTKIEQLTKKEALLQEYKKGVITKIFNQEIRFKDDYGKEFPEWKEKRFEDFTTFFSGGTPTSSNKNYYSGNIPFIGSGNIDSYSVEQFITQEALNNSSAKLVVKGDLLYALYGATSGEVAISKIDGAINQAILCIRSNENIYFLYQWLKCNKKNIISTYLQGGQGNLSSKIIKELKIELPDIKEQTKIANFLSSIDKKIELTTKELNSTKEFKKALLQQMFV